jgi:hypothetical protein
MRLTIRRISIGNIIGKIILVVLVMYSSGKAMIMDGITPGIDHSIMGMFLMYWVVAEYFRFDPFKKPSGVFWEFNYDDNIIKDETGGKG